jgi:glutathione S-transferase
MPQDGHELIAANDGPFKTALDRYKYATRYDSDPEIERAKAAQHLLVLDDLIGHKPWLFGPDPTLADMAIVTFVRQFANTDRTWFDQQDWPNLAQWLENFLNSERFGSIMTKYSPWGPGEVGVSFPNG